MNKSILGMNPNIFVIL